MSRGYRGIWFRLGQFEGEHGDKYAGGLGTYTMKHVPTAVHEAGKTFFTYGGTRPGERDLLVVASYYDHDADEVPRPTVVDPKPEPNPAYDSGTVVDPHDNASLALDGEGYVWVFVAGRGRTRPGRIYRSGGPHDTASFEQVAERDLFAYPQPWWVDGRFLVCFTIYDGDGNRELFWETDFGEPRKLAGIGGHYGVSEAHEGAVYTAFNWHPGGDVDRRTNLYVARTRDGGAWETIGGRGLETPLTEPDNDALVADYAARDRLVYLNDLAVDEAGSPAVLYVTSEGPEPGPENDPRRWRLTRRGGESWRTETITTSDHNYDSGSLYRRDGEWWVLGPTEPGPQPYHTGGAMAVWRRDGGGWKRTRVFEPREGYNATYARRPRNAAAPFEAFWADGRADRESDSRLYFGSLDGEYRQLPAEMDGERTVPVRR